MHPGPAALRLCARLAPLLAASFALGCAAARPAPEVTPAAIGGAPPTEVRLTLLQLNDVYEITPVEAGRAGGLARVATLRRRLLAENPQTFTVLAGDLLSPSALGTARVDGQRLAGRQMVAVLNAVGLDLATFGNHEFDLSEEDLERRLAESRFRWTSANVSDAAGGAFPGVSRHQVLTLEDGHGEPVDFAFIGVTLAVNQRPWVRYGDAAAAVRRELAALGERPEVVVALTHLALADDDALAEAIPEIDLVLGGHEHENLQVRRGADFTPILKADANARSVYVHELRYDTAARRLAIASRLVPVTAELAEDPATAAVVADWVERGYQGFREQGFEPTETVASVSEALDGREAVVRSRATHLTDLIARALRHEAPAADLAVYNSGAIRIDDVLPPGPVTQYDVIRVLPFGGAVVTAEVGGALLARLLDQGAASAGSGAYLQSAGVAGRPGAWSVAGSPLDPAGAYRVVTNDFLVSGAEQGMDFFSPANPDLRILETGRDVRRAVIEELQRTPADAGAAAGHAQRPPR